MYNRIILCGFGFTGCELVALAALSKESYVAIEELAVEIEKLRRTSILIVDDLKRIQSDAAVLPDPIPYVDGQIKKVKPKYVRQQHKYAKRYHGRRK
ncbi:hypothetical protein [Sphingobacterium suaedae]|uniref:Uncharacterized protein n=1 Tax=Sphingobacterium suaedae TaxID=1686402 RepID=A0ABW5KIM3_9SPHI